MHENLKNQINYIFMNNVKRFKIMNSIYLKFGWDRFERCILFTKINKE